MDNSQTIYKNKTDPLAATTLLGNQPIICSNQPRKLSCYKSESQESRLLFLPTIKEAK